MESPRVSLLSALGTDSLPCVLTTSRLQDLDGRRPPAKRRPGGEGGLSPNDCGLAFGGVCGMKSSDGKFAEDRASGVAGSVGVWGRIPSIVLSRKVGDLPVAVVLDSFEIPFSLLSAAETADCVSVTGRAGSFSEVCNNNDSSFSFSSD